MSFVIVMLAACDRTPSVPDELRAEVPAEVVAEVEPQFDALSALDQQIPATAASLEQARGRIEAEQARLAALEEALQSDRRVKELAVERGDASGAQAAELRMQERQAAIAGVQATLVDADREARSLEAALALLRADREVALAEIELARARALGPEHEVEVRRFERRLERAQRQQDEARRAVARIREGAPGT